MPPDTRGKRADHDRHEDNGDRRVVLHFDLDAFYVACERELNPALRNVPTAVSQYNPYGSLEAKESSDVHGRLVQRPSSRILRRDAVGSSESDPPASARIPAERPPPQSLRRHPDANGSLIAVSYEARACGVKRNDRGQDAVRKCPGLHIVQVPVRHGKADLAMYRNASKRVMARLSRSIQQAGDQACSSSDNTRIEPAAASATANSRTQASDRIVVEVASIDEVYVDVTATVLQMASRIEQCQEHRVQSILCCPSGTTARLWPEIVDTASQCTTVGGVEVLSEAAQAANALDKDEVRRGSHLQVLDSSSIAIDTGSRSWWNRPLQNWSHTEIQLACGAYLAAKARTSVAQAFEGGIFTLSAGISSNKTMAKLASGLKKPNRQTLINRADDRALRTLLHPLPLGRIRGLGGKYGEKVANALQIQTVGQLVDIPLQKLQSFNVSTDGNDDESSQQQQLPSPGREKIGVTGRFLFDIARGICRDPVRPRTKPKSVSCSKTFYGLRSIPVTNHTAIERWVSELCAELIERLEADRNEHDRRATTLTAYTRFGAGNSFRISQSKQCQAPGSLSGYKKAALVLVEQLIKLAEGRQREHSRSDTKGKTAPANPETVTSKSLKLLILGFSGSNFADRPMGTRTIASAFQAAASIGTRSTTLPASRRLTSDSTAGGSALSNRRAQTDDVDDDIKERKPLRGKRKPHGISAWFVRTDRPAGRRRDSAQLSGDRTASLDTLQASSRRVHVATGGTKGVLEKLPPDQTPGQTVQVPTMEEIDSSVLAELPEDVRRSVYRDIRQQQRKRQRGASTATATSPTKSANIRSYFGKR